VHRPQGVAPGIGKADPVFSVDITVSRHICPCATSIESTCPLATNIGKSHQKGLLTSIQSLSFARASANNFMTGGYSPLAEGSFSGSGRLNNSNSVPNRADSPAIGL
jgi:hypothetical protein